MTLFSKTRLIDLTVAELQEVIRAEMQAQLKQHPVVIQEDRQLTVKQFKEKFGYKSYAAIYTLIEQGCPFTGEGHHRRILESNAIQWFENRGKR